MRQDVTIKLLRGLNEQNLHHVRGRRLLTQLVAAGEYDLSVETNLNTVITMSQQGAPVWFAPLRPLFLRPSFLFMTRTAPHPFAGALLIDYLLSEEGQRILAAHDRMAGPSQGAGAGNPAAQRTRRAHARPPRYRPALRGTGEKIYRTVSGSEMMPHCLTLLACPICTSRALIRTWVPRLPRV